MKKIPFALLLALPALADDFADQKKTLLDAITNFNDTKGVAAVLKIAEFDSKPAIDALLTAHAASSKAADPVEKEREKVCAIMDANAYDPETKKWKGEYAKYKEAKDKYDDLSAKIARLGSIKYAITLSLSKMRSETATKELIAKLQSNAETGVRVSIAEALAHSDHPDVRAALVAQLKKEKEAGMRVALIDALRVQKARDKETVELLAKHLKDEFWQVRAAAAQALQSARSVDSVDALIEALKTADGRLKTDVNDALVAITGVDKHENAEVWKLWWDKNRDAFLAGTYKPEPGERGRSAGATTFYGIPVNSKHVVFILDRSGSMAEKAKWKPDDSVATGPNATPDVPKPKGDRKIDIAKYELKKVLAMLPEGTEFSIIFFNHLMEPMGGQLVALTKDSRKRAFDFIDPIEPSGATNISDSLMKGLEFAGAGAGERLLKGGVDTIYLLSDGMPTSGITDAQELLEKLRAANATRKVTVHTIAIEPSVESERLMKQLAKEHNGTYAKR